MIINFIKTITYCLISGSLYTSVPAKFSFTKLSIYSCFYVLDSPPSVIKYATETANLVLNTNKAVICWTSYWSPVSHNKFTCISKFLWAINTLDKIFTLGGTVLIHLKSLSHNPFGLSGNPNILNILLSYRKILAVLYHCIENSRKPVLLWINRNYNSSIFRKLGVENKYLYHKIQDIHEVENY